jgi:hypothetical protein
MRVRTPNFFEKILLIIGILIVMLGYAFIYRVFQFDSFLTWEAVQTIFLWLILIGVIILVAVSENMKEELRVVIENQTEETRLLREDLRKK